LGHVVIIKLNGGASDAHMMSLSDMAKLSDALQKLSYNLEYQRYGTKQQEIYIQANREGSFEIILGLLDPATVQALKEGIGAAILYDLIKGMRSYILFTEKRAELKQLLDQTFELAVSLAEAEYYDVNLERKKKKVEQNIQILNSEFASFNAVKSIASIVRSSEGESYLKPSSISFSYADEEVSERLEIDASIKDLINAHESDTIKLENLIISGVPDKLSRGSKSFIMDVNFMGKVKVRANDEQLTVISDYFRDKKSIKIEIEPIVKMGTLVETREGKLINVLEV
jgi:hypothetical protein